MTGAEQPAAPRETGRLGDLWIGQMACSESFCSEEAHLFF